ncbi:dienelactone hydrolase family protein [[Mycobacterium] nativiensis]|uniref:Dienelactone hydrolase family protein n=1 Tax=[Mycobacterium] nativiensis TaxID=2855503 RepID=A0ABU5Y210_9MYCO|nr:dienelactone hydrolase family protein [Mycolicibacter sp. MYC340]MEB3034092.1 dienelactone hydrolase family protein [Mycolicibacter sp. MYC340]
MATIKRLYTTLTRPGPHRVLRGDLAFAGLAGVVYTPQSGYRLPAVAFGHDWLTGADRYAGLLEHLASWGIVAVAPDTGRGLAPSVLDLSGDLGRALDIATEVRLGPGRISVDRNRVAVAGHGFGGSAAVFAAAGPSVKPKAVASIFPTVTAPPAEQAAAALDVPGVIFAAPGDAKALRSNAVELAHSWRSATLRVVSKASSAGLPQGRRLTGFFGLPTSDRRTQRRVRALLTGYLLAQLVGDKTYREFTDAALQLPGTEALDALPEPASPEEKIAALFG